jgi:hypothetical protein
VCPIERGRNIVTGIGLVAKWKEDGWQKPTQVPLFVLLEIKVVIKQVMGVQIFAYSHRLQ